MVRDPEPSTELEGEDVEFLVSSLLDYENQARWVPVGWRLERAANAISQIRGRIPSAVEAWDGQHPSIRAPWSNPTAYEIVNFDGYTWAFHDAHIGTLTLLASEALHHIRSALDYVAYQLVIADAGTAYAKSQFPIAAKANAFRQEVKRRLPGVQPAHLALVEAVQPYRGVTWAGHLNELSNRDKHRYPVDVSACYSFRINPSDKYADPLGKETHRGFQIERATLTFRFIGTQARDLAELEVVPTLESILIGAVNLTTDILEALSVTEITIDRIAAHGHG